MPTDAESVGADPRYFVETVARAAHLLRTIDRLGGGPVTLSELVSELGWHKAAVYRLVRTLDSLGFLRTVDRGYVLGPGLIALGQRALNLTGLPRLAGPHLQRLADELDETVVLTVLDAADIVYVAQVQKEAILMTSSRVGSRLPAYCTCSGQVQLAALSDQEVSSRLVGVDFEARGPNTAHSIDELLVRLKDVRSNGFAINDGELAAGHRSLAVPVFDHMKSVAAALSVSVPAARVSVDELRSMLPALTFAASEMSADLGAPPGTSLLAT